MNGRAVHLDTGEGPRCGHPRACQLSANPGDVTCGICLMRLTGLSSTSGRTWAEQPHGTEAACRRHYRRGEKPCRSCRQAAARRWADYSARKAS